MTKSNVVRCDFNKIVDCNYNDSCRDLFVETLQSCDESQKENESIRSMFLDLSDQYNELVDEHKELLCDYIEVIEMHKESFGSINKIHKYVVKAQSLLGEMGDNFIILKDIIENMPKIPSFANFAEWLKSQPVHRYVKPEDYVYMIGNKKKKVVKVGVSSNVKRRCSELCSGAPYDLDIIHAVRGSYAMETFLHVKLSEYHITREWFSYSDEMENVFLAECKNFKKTSKKG